MGVNKLRIKTALRAMIFLLMMSAALFAGNVSVYAQSDDTAAEDIIKQCEVVASKRIVSYQNLWDGGNYYVFAVEGNGEQYLSVDLKGNAAQGIYIRWAREPSPWRLEAALADGQTVDSRHGEFGFLQEYAALPQGTVSFRMITDDGKTCQERISISVSKDSRTDRTCISSTGTPKATNISPSFCDNCTSGSSESSVRLSPL